MYKVEIDFDEASREWRKNKIELEYGQFRYCCSQLTKKGEKCKNKITKNGKCCIHLKSKK